MDIPNRLTRVSFAATDASPFASSFIGFASDFIWVIPYGAIMIIIMASIMGMYHLLATNPAIFPNVGIFRSLP